MYKNIYVDVKSCPEFYAEVEYKEGESLGHLQKRMRSINETDDTFKRNCALLGRKNSELVFPKEFGTAHCSEILFKELQNVREEIMQSFYLFTFHKIYELGVVEDNLARISLRSGLHTEQVKDADKDDDNAVADLIRTKELISLFNQMSDLRKRNRIRYRFQNQDEIEDTFGEVIINVLNRCTSVIKTNKEFEVAKKVIVLFNYYSTTQYLYVLSFQKQAEETEYHYIDKSMIPYKDFYEGENGIVDRMKKEDYVGMTLRQAISEKIAMYIRDFSIGSE